MNKKAFTLIELLTVIAILGILVLIAAPKFLGYTEKANIAKIQTGIKSMETVVDLNSINNEDLTNDWVLLKPNEIQEINNSGKLINRKGLVSNNLKESSKYIPLKKTGNFDSIKWNEGGAFILDGDSVYYYNEDLNVKQDEGEVSDFTFIKMNGGYEVPGKGVGVYVYTGADSTVVIPDEIEGYKLTSYYFMFSGSNVSKVISSNKNVTNMNLMFFGSQSPLLDLSSLDTSNVIDMSSMFYGSQAEVLNLDNFKTSNVTNMQAMFFESKVEDLSLNSFNTSSVTDMKAMFWKSEAKKLNLKNFDTSNVTNMYGMFYESKATILDLSSFNTSNVTDMESMFSGSQAEMLDLSGFNTSNVINMSGMFNGSHATSLDLSSFDTSKVNDMTTMFSGSKAKSLNLSSFNVSNSTSTHSMFYLSEATSGFAKTQEDANKLNSSLGKPDGLNFTVN